MFAVASVRPLEQRERPGVVLSRDYDSHLGHRSLISPTSSDLDQEIRGLLALYRIADSSERRRIEASLSEREMYTLHCFAERMSVFGVRQGCAELVDEAVEALALVDPNRIDPRDVGLPFEIVFHALRRTGRDVQSSLASAAKRGGPGAQPLIESANRPNQSTERAWQANEVMTPNGVGFMERDFKDYGPSHHLVDIAVKLADIVIADRYVAESLKFATEVPRVWIGTANSVEPQLRRSSGTVHMKFLIRRGVVPDPERHHLLLWLSECGSEEDATALVKACLDNPNRRAANCAVSSDCLFCIVVGGSFYVDTPSHETMSSLTRFHAAIANVLQGATGERD